MRIAVIGGGIAGMSLAHYLVKQNNSVVVYEKEEALGGLAGSFPVAGTFLERYYHHIFLSDKYTIKLIEELGFKKDIAWRESKMAVYCPEGLYPFGTPLDLARFKPFSLIDKIRFVFSTLYLQYGGKKKALEETTAERFLLKTAGHNVYEKIWKPLLSGKFGDACGKTITAAWLQARIHSRGGSKKNNFSREQLGYLNGSLKRLFDELERRIMAQAANAVNKNSAVEKININNEGKVVVSPYNEVFDAACLCVPGPIALKLAGHLFGGEYSGRLEAIKYRSALCVVLLTDRNLSPYYWINISDERIPFTGLMGHTSLVPKADYGNNDILYAGRYISADERQYALSDAELVRLYTGHIKDIFPDFTPSTIKKYFVFRDLYAQPIVEIGYKDRIPSFETPVKNIFINNNSQIYPEDRGLSPGIRQSLNLAGRIARKMSGSYV